MDYWLPFDLLKGLHDRPIRCRTPEQKKGRYRRRLRTSLKFNWSLGRPPDEYRYNYSHPNAYQTYKVSNDQSRIFRDIWHDM